MRPFKALGCELESAFEPGKFFDALNPLDGMGSMLKSSKKELARQGVIDHTVSDVEQN